MFLLIFCINALSCRISGCCSMQYISSSKRPTNVLECTVFRLVISGCGRMLAVTAYIDGGHGLLLL